MLISAETNMICEIMAERGGLVTLTFVAEAFAVRKQLCINGWYVSVGMGVGEIPILWMKQDTSKRLLLQDGLCLHASRLPRTTAMGVQCHCFIVSAHGNRWWARARLCRSWHLVQSVSEPCNGGRGIGCM